MDYYYGDYEQDLDYGQDYLQSHLNNVLAHVHSTVTEHDLLVEKSLRELLEEDEGYESGVDEEVEEDEDGMI